MVDNLTKMTADVNVISKLDNYPPDDPGMTPSKLKELFDKGSNTIKDFINNTLIEEINPFLGREILRDSAERNRVSAENARAEAEEARETAEGTRISREEARKTAESARISREEAREGAERQRELNEEERIRNEGYRNENEYDRETAEGLRVSAETARKNAEIIRAEAEEERKTAESARISREEARKNAENARADAEEARERAESARADAEEARENAESARSVFEVYNPGKSYVVGNKVYYLGSSYRCIKNSSGVAPTNTEYWMIIARKGEVYFPTFSVDENMQLIMHDDFNYDGTISFRLNNGYLIQEVV